MADDDGHTIAELVRELEEQERRLVLPRFDDDDAWALGTLLVDLARSRGLSVTVDVRRGRQQLFHAALPGTNADNDSWVERKSRTVQRFDASSYLVGRRIARSGVTPGADRGIDPALYSFHGGSFPVRVAGAGLVATLTVSGLSEAADHALAVEAMTRHLARTG
ncbi:MAG: heme-degrading domain-containing protein [Actinomycetota bacterium]|nr:heme-degrading domain-containing protein [Actinomycetota bacterium]